MMDKDGTRAYTKWMTGMTASERKDAGKRDSIWSKAGLSLSAQGSVELQQGARRVPAARHCRPLMSPVSEFCASEKAREREREREQGGREGGREGEVR